jgi:[ribosomal protein S18]-alanine N-acetyltransferase
LIQETIMFQITPMCGEDLVDVMAIERVSHLEPWSEAAFLAELELSHSRVLVARMAGTSSQEQGLLPEKGTLAGYICFWNVAGEAQILNLSVHPRYRMRGIGRALLVRALKLAWEEGARKAVLEVRQGNPAARRLYESVGFEQWGERPGYYGVVKEAAILMGLELGSPIV